MAVEDDVVRWCGETMTRRQSPPRFGVRLAGSGSYLPGPGVSNEEMLLAHPMATTAGWIATHTGIESRHYAADDQATSDLAAEAVRRALADADVDMLDVDRLLLCTTTGDWTSPAAACRVQQLLGAQCPVVDVQSACASWMYGLDMGARMVATGLRNVVVVGADVKSRFIRRGDHRLGPVLADGAGAVVLDSWDGPGGLLQLELYADGSKTANLMTPAGGSARPATARTVAEDLHSTRLGVPGGLLKEHAVAGMAALTEQICAQQGIAVSDVDWVVPHQANGAITAALVTRLGLPADRVVDVISHAGNIVAATIPYAYDVAAQQGRFRPGQLVVLVTVGAGYTGGAALYEVPAA